MAHTPRAGFHTSTHPLDPIFSSTQLPVKQPKEVVTSAPQPDNTEQHVFKRVQLLLSSWSFLEKSCCVLLNGIVFFFAKNLTLHF